MTTRAPDSAMVDEQWRGCDLRGAAPLFALALLLTFSLLVTRLLFNELLDALIAYLIVLVLWPTLLFVAVYRAVTYTFRITDRALVVDRGFLHGPILPLPYAGIAKVEHGDNWIHALLNIGWVRATMADGRSVKMPSLRDPAGFAALLRARAAAAAEKSKNDDPSSPP